MISNLIDIQLELFKEKFVNNPVLIWFWNADDVEAFLKESMLRVEQEVKKEVAEEICRVVDVIELENRDSSLTEWKEYKRIRNTIRDAYKLYPSERSTKK